MDYQLAKKSLFVFLLRSRREILLFGGLAAAGAAACGLVTGILDFEPTSMGGVFLITGVHLGLCGAGIAGGLFWAGILARKARRPELKALGKVIGQGAAAGAISGLVGQMLYNTYPHADWVKNVILRSLSWALMGVVLGFLLAFTLTNLGRLRGAIGGGVGGVLGAIGFLIVGVLVPTFLARVCGFAILGAALGICMVTIDALLREASLEVIWGPKESMMMSLGHDSITIGGGADTIYVSGLQPTLARVRLAEGRIEYFDTTTNQVTMLRNGSRLKLGVVEIVVHAAA